MGMEHSYLLLIALFILEIDKNLNNVLFIMVSLEYIYIHCDINLIISEKAIKH